MEDIVDKLALEFSVLGLELDSLTPEQKHTLEKSLAAPTQQPRLVVRRDAQFRMSLNTSQHAARPVATSQAVAQPAPPTLTRNEIGRRLQEAARDGKLDVALAGRFYTSPEIALQQIPFDVREAYHIPETLTGSVQKSGSTQDEALSLRQIRARLLRACQCNATDPRVLGWFDSYPNQALKALPFDVRKSYGLPEQLEEPLRKS